MCHCRQRLGFPFDTARCLTRCVRRSKHPRFMSVASNYHCLRAMPGSSACSISRHLLVRVRHWPSAFETRWTRRSPWDCVRGLGADAASGTGGSRLGSMGAEVQRPLATVVIGGVVSAMIMSLFVVRAVHLLHGDDCVGGGRLALTLNVAQAKARDGD